MGRRLGNMMKALSRWFDEGYYAAQERLVEQDNDLAFLVNLAVVVITSWRD
jgi:hypothetical protein